MPPGRHQHEKGTLGASTGFSIGSAKYVYKMAKVVIRQDREFLSGSQEERNAGMTYETTAGRYKNPFLLSSLPAFLRSSGAMVVEAILFGCCYAAS